MCIRDRDRPKIDAKMYIILDSIFWFIFGRFLLPTYTPWNQLKSSRLVFSWFLAFKVDIDFWTDFGANLARFSIPKSIKIHPNIDSKRHQKNDRFWNGFFDHLGSILGSKLGPCWLHFRTESGGNRSKIDQKIEPSIFHRFFRFFIDFWSILDPQKTTGPSGTPPLALKKI